MKIVSINAVCLHNKQFFQRIYHIVSITKQIGIYFNYKNNSW